MDDCLFEFIKDCGFFPSFNSISRSAKTCLSLEFVRSSNSFILHYPAPNNFGMQNFVFDPQDFLSAYEAAQYKRQTPKSDYLPFVSLFFMPNQRVSWAFSFFQINPTTIRQALHQNKSIHRRLFLKPRQAALLKALNLYSVEKVTSSFTPDIQEITRCQTNMALAVSKAASSHDLSFFDFYLENYQNIRSLKRLSSHLSPRQYKKVLNEFSKSVDEVQKKL